MTDSCQYMEKSLTGGVVDCRQEPKDTNRFFSQIILAESNSCMQNTVHMVTAESMSQEA